MIREKGPLVPPPNLNEDPNATKRPAPPPTPSERVRQEEQAQEALQARLLSEIDKLGQNAEALAAEREVAGELGLAEQDLRQAREAFAQVTLAGLDVKSEHAAEAGIDDIQAYRAWLDRRFRGLPPTEHPPEPPDEPEEKK